MSVALIFTLLLVAGVTAIGVGLLVALVSVFRHSPRVEVR